MATTNDAVTLAPTRVIGAVDRSKVDGSRARDLAPSASGASGEGGPVGAVEAGGESRTPLGKKILTTLPIDTAVGSVMDNRRELMRQGLAAARRNVDLIEGRPFDRMHICETPGDNARVETKKDPVTGKMHSWSRGFKECGLVWLCPKCGARQAWRQEEELRRAIAGYSTLGPDHEGVFVTLTASHASWRTLEEMLHAVTKGFTALVDSRLMRGLAKDGTIFGWVRALEVTYSLKEGKRGWHPHLHVLFFVTDRDAFMTAWGRKERGIPYAWRHALNTVSEAAGYKAIGCHPLRQDARPAELGDAAKLSGYMTKGRSKWDIAREVARGDLKSVAKESVTPQEMLLRSGHDEEMAKLWREYALATKRMQALTQSNMKVDGKRVPVCDYLAAVLRGHEERQVTRERLAQERAFDDQAKAWDALTDDEQEELIRRERETEAAALACQPVVSTALYLQPRALEQRRERTKRWDPRELQAMVDAVRTGGAQAGADYAREAGLPFGVRKPRARLTGDMRQRRQEWRVFKEGRMAFEDSKREELLRDIAGQYSYASDGQIAEWVEERLMVELEEYDDQHRPFTGNPIAEARSKELYREELAAFKKRLRAEKPELTEEEFADRVAQFAAERKPDATWDEVQNWYSEGRYDDGVSAALTSRQDLFDRGCPTFLGD